MRVKKVGRHIAHSTALFLGHCLAYFPELWFSIRMKYYIWKYNGAANVPGEVIGKLLGGRKGMTEISKTMRVTSALQDIGNMFNQDFVTGDYIVRNQVSYYVRGELQDPEAYDRIMAWRELPPNKVRRAVFNELIRVGDLKQHKVDFQFSNEKRAELEDFLDRKD